MTDAMPISDASRQERLDQLLKDPFADPVSGMGAGHARGETDPDRRFDALLRDPMEGRPPEEDPVRNRFRDMFQGEVAPTTAIDVPDDEPAPQGP